jgi:hypothetical protein
MTDIAVKGTVKSIERVIKQSDKGDSDTFKYTLECKDEDDMDSTVTLKIEKKLEILQGESMTVTFKENQTKVADHVK